MHTYVSDPSDWKTAIQAAENLFSRTPRIESDECDDILTANVGGIEPLDAFPKMGLALSGYMIGGTTGGGGGSIVPEEHIGEDFSGLSQRADGGAYTAVDFIFDDIGLEEYCQEHQSCGCQFRGGRASIYWSLNHDKVSTMDDILRHHREMILLCGGGATVGFEGCELSITRTDSWVFEPRPSIKVGGLSVPTCVYWEFRDIPAEELWKKILLTPNVLGKSGIKRIDFTVGDGVGSMNNRAGERSAASYAAAYGNLPDMETWEDVTYQLDILTAAGAHHAYKLEPDQSSSFFIGRFEVPDGGECSIRLVMSRGRPRFEIKAPRAVSKEQLEKLLGMSLKKR